MLTKQDIKQKLLQRQASWQVTSLAKLPHFSTMLNTTKAAEIIVDSMKKNQKILIVGDYDADGVCSCALLQVFFTRLDYKNFEIVIPNRFLDGYGLSLKLLNRLNLQDISLIITADNGITAFEAGEFCKENNITLVITDHHTPESKLPTCDCLVNPKQEQCEFKYKEICGCVVAWYLCAAIKDRLHFELDLKVFLPLLAIATIADVMPLVDLNFTLVKMGIKTIAKAKFNESSLDSNSQISLDYAPALVVIKELLQQISAENIAFKLNPLLNSAGRMNDATNALRFLLSPSVNLARENLQNLIDSNNQRKQIQESIFIQAMECIVDMGSFVYACGKQWHNGVIGIICSKLVEAFEKPAFVLSDDGSGKLSGSGRSYGNMDLIRSAQKAQLHTGLLKEYGGHSGAMGLSLDSSSVSEFMQNLKNNIITCESSKICEIWQINPLDLDYELLSILDLFEPYGECNAKPIFTLNHIFLASARAIGKENLHISYIFKDKNSNATFEAISFFAKHKLEPNEYYDIKFTLSFNAYRNKLQLKLC